MVTDWEGECRLKLTGPGGRQEIEPPAVILATGCRERPRSARLVPGSRPAGVMTTSTLQQLVHLQGRKVGRRAVIVGRGARQLLGGRDSRARGRLGGRAGHRAPQAPVADRLPGRRRGPLPGAGLDPDGGQRDPRQPRGWSPSSSPSSSPAVPGRVDCDLVIFTADWIPDHELAVMAGCELDRGTPRPIGRHGAADHQARGVRGREPAASGRDRRRLRARRPPRGTGGRRLPARPRRVAVARSAHRPGAPRLGRAQPPARERAPAAPRPIPAALARVRPPRAASRSARAGASCGVAGSGGWFPGARPTSPPAGRRGSIPIRAR